MSHHQQPPPPAPPGAGGDPDLPPHSDNVEEELGRIRLALDTVYSTATPTTTTTTTNVHYDAGNASNNNQELFRQRNFASRYLTSFQSTAISWVVCDRLLWETVVESGSGSGGIGFIPADRFMKHQQRQFFAAQTLHTKCRFDRDVQQLLQQQQPQQQGESLRNSTVLISLRDSLLQHLNRSVLEANNTVLTTRLAMCISALAVQMGWTTILHDLLSGTHVEQQAQTILFLVRALPEECASDRLILIHDESRFIMRDHLIDASAAVFAFLLHHLSSSSSSSSSNGNNQQQQHPYTLRVLQGWHAWIRYVPVRPHVIAESPLLPATVQALVAAATSNPNDWLSPDIEEQAADVVVEILRMYPSHGPPDNQILMQQMLQLLSRLPLQQVLSSSSSSLEDDDSSLVRDYCRIVTEMGESYLSWILMAAASSAEEQDIALRLVDWVLLCSSLINDREVAAITLSFWYRMVMDLEETEPLEWRQDLIDQYSTRLLQLITVCVQNLMKFPADISELPQDQVEEINRHRYHVSETVEDGCRLLGGQVVLQRIAELLQQQIVGDSNHNPLANWQGLESCLSCLVAIHKFVPEDEPHVLPFVFERLIPGLTSTTTTATHDTSSSSSIPAPLRFTICKVIGKFARWLSVRARSNPNLIPPLLPFLAQGLSVPECAPAASVSIKELCVESHPHSFAIGQPVLELYEQVAAANVARDHQSQQHPSSSTLELRDELELLEGVCVALSKHIHLDPSNSNGSVFLQRLVQPIGNRLNTSSTLSTSTPRTILPDIQRLAIIVQHLKVFVDLSSQQQPPQHPIVDLMQSLWPILETLIARFPNDTNTAEQICRLHKHSIRSCGAVAYSPIVGTLMRHLVEGYRRSHQAPFLYAASICVAEYGASPDSSTKESLFGMIEAMSNITFSFLTNVGDFNNNPDVVEELFYLMDRVLNHCPGMLVANPAMLQALVQAAILCMKVDHHGAHKGTVKFLDCLVSLGLNLATQQGQNETESQRQQRTTLEHVLSQYGGGILKNLVGALAGDLPSYSPKIPDVLWKLSRLFGNNGVFAQWLSTCLGEAASLHEGIKNECMVSLTAPNMTREDFIVAVRAFQNACNRQYRRQQTGSSSGN